MPRYLVSPDSPRQCAWCQNLMDASNSPIRGSHARAGEVSHGICAPCYQLTLDRWRRDRSMLAKATRPR